MVDKQTSDERLLKLIEGSGERKGKPVIAPRGERKTFAGQLPAKLNFPALKAELKKLKISLFSLNKGLIGLAILLTLIFLYTLFSAPVVPKSNAVFFTPQDSSAIIKLITAGESQGLARKNILNQDLTRDFFLPPGSKSIAYTQDGIQDLTEEVKNLKLVGIIWSKNPEVMIENAQDSRTYTFKKGESFAEQFKVKEISRNSVTLEIATPDGPKDYELR